MNFRQSKIRIYQTPVLISLIVTCLLGCGGGGEDSTTSVVTANSNAESQQSTAVDYSPDSVKLSDTAKASIDLYVEPTFSFDSFKSVNFDISVTDLLKRPLSDVMLTISIIDSEIIELDDPMLQKKSLLTKVFTDANGQIYVTLEVALSVKKVLLELNTLGLENDAIVSLDETGVVTYSFEQI